MPEKPNAKRKSKDEKRKYGPAFSGQPFSFFVFRFSFYLSSSAAIKILNAFGIISAFTLFIFPLYSPSTWKWT
jgi:hypothetical protein